MDEPPADAEEEAAEQLTSVAELLAEAAVDSHPGLLEVLRRHTWVGLASDSWALAQHGTKLYLLAAPRIARELFRQLALRRFGRLAALRLQPPAPLEALLLEAAGEVAEGERAEWAACSAQLLLAKGPMLAEYFSVGVEQGEGGAAVLTSLPALLDGHTPALAALPEFLAQLCSDTDWASEKGCFAAVARHLGAFYVEQLSEREVREAVMPALRSAAFCPPRCWAENGTVMQVASLEQLYRVFERC